MTTRLLDDPTIVGWTSKPFKVDGWSNTLLDNQCWIVWSPCWPTNAGWTLKPYKIVCFKTMLDSHCWIFRHGCQTTLPIPNMALSPRLSLCSKSLRCLNCFSKMIGKNKYQNQERHIQLFDLFMQIYLHRLPHCSCKFYKRNVYLYIFFKMQWIISNRHQLLILFMAEVLKVPELPTLSESPQFTITFRIWNPTLCKFERSWVHMRSKAWRTRELSAYGKVHSCNLPYVKTSRVRAILERFCARMNKTFPNFARTREVFA